MGGNTRALAYQYDANGNRIRITHPDGTYFNTSWDALGRPLTLQANGATTLAAFDYYPHGGLYAAHRIGQATEINYDNVQRPYVLHHYLPTAGDVYWVDQRNPAGQVISTVRTNDSYAWAGQIFGRVGRRSILAFSRMSRSLVSAALAAVAAGALALPTLGCATVRVAPMTYELCAASRICTIRGTVTAELADHGWMGRLDFPDGRCIAISLPDAQMAIYDKMGRGL